MDCVLGCDIGSQGVKVVLLSAQGELISEAGEGYAIDFPQPAWAEQPVERWTDALDLAVRKVMRQSGVAKEAVRAVGLDAQVDGMVAVDGAGKALRPAIIWMDRRAVAQCQSVSQVCNPQRLFELSGLNSDPYHVAPKIRWMAERQPDLYQRARHFLLPGSYVAYQLTGELGVDYSNASSTLLMDVRERVWSQELCDCFQVPIEALAPIYPANAVLGGLRPAFAEEMGLLPGTPVVVGCGDEHAACLGAGVIEPGLVCDITGTAEPICAAADSPIFDPTGLVETHCHADPDLWLVENPGFVSGANYRWFRDQFARDLAQSAKAMGINVYDLLNAGAAKIPPGSQGLIFLPCMMGAVTPTWNSDARGVFMGISLSHGWEHFVRAILEGTAFALRDITDRMNAIDLDVREIRAVGGGSISPLWLQIKADVANLPVSRLQTSETTALGAALLALNGAGLMGSLAEGVKKVVHVVETFEPDDRSRSIYEEYYQLYRETYFSLLPVFSRAARISPE